MRLSIITLCMLLAVSAHGELSEVIEKPDSAKWVIAIHGGAGGATRATLSAEQEQESRERLTAALEAGAAVLEAGGEGSDAIVAALSLLEDSPAFNAGRGAALDEHGRAKHDASIMRGEDLAAGAVAGSSRIRNPIEAALAVMRETPNVMLHGDGADWFASEQGLKLADPLYFVTEARREALLKAKAAGIETVALPRNNDWAYGTVGAVVLDVHGNLSAGTTTGGRTNKRYGRIGDSPIIGAGTYAANQSCAVSATGHGEYFMRFTVARDICARVEFRGDSLEAAATSLLFDVLLPLGGTGGTVSMTPDGQVVFTATTANMRRGVHAAGSRPRVAIYSDEAVD